MAAELVAQFPVLAAQQRLFAAGGGYEIVHRTAGMEVGVYVLIAPGTDDQQPHEDDEAYVVLSGQGTLVIGEDRRPLREGEGAYVAARVPHHFEDFERLSLLVFFSRPG